jgi:DNA mismatch repair protein MutL
MTIEILPARLANQIAAGEVVERPASVVKELVENSLDAGATSIKIDIEKGGSKRIRITDNGHGIVKQQLTLALSRHATSKVKNLTDLEGISSLGFRGEALASISSVSRLTLSSKTMEQQQAWQACAQGRDMDVTIQPTAHPKGSTIDVVDLFFNTPARRKFLRTDKTEFYHIDEVIKRMALAHFNVAFVLTHNGAIVRNYPLALTDKQQEKRVAKICSQSFMDNAIKVHCQHDGLQLHGWVAQPNYSRKQNDICFSYVNGRMMRDKLINHAIRQSFNDLLANDVYPAFVLFLQLDCRDVDVNVHPAKHEVRFHQGRYIHDFIYSVCHQALVEKQVVTEVGDEVEDEIQKPAPQVYQTESDSYIKPLTQVADSQPTTEGKSIYSQSYQGKPVAPKSIDAYQQLISPLRSEINEIDSQNPSHGEATFLNGGVTEFQFVAPHYGVCTLDHQLHLISLRQWEIKLNEHKMQALWQKPLVSQPLLLPIKIKVSKQHIDFVGQYLDEFEKLGMVLQLVAPHHLQVRQFPALLRQSNVSSSISLLLEQLMSVKDTGKLTEKHWQNAFISLMSSTDYNEFTSQNLWEKILNTYPETIKKELRLNSARVDLTSAIEKLN